MACIMKIEEILKRYPIINSEWVYVDSRNLVESIRYAIAEYVDNNMNMNSYSHNLLDSYIKLCTGLYDDVVNGHFVRTIDCSKDLGVAMIASKNTDMWGRSFPRYRDTDRIYHDLYAPELSKLGLVCVQVTSVSGNTIYCLDVYDYGY